MRRVDVLNNPLVWIVGGALIASWLYGVFHTYRDHNGVQAVVALLIPPYGLYMAAEPSFGHGDGIGESFDLPVSEMIQKSAALCETSDALQRELGLDDEKFAEFCTCAWTSIIDNFPANENEYVDQYGKNSPQLEQVKKDAMDSCRARSQYLPAP